jgi:molybdopterin synthase catalytic subunit
MSTTTHRKRDIFTQGAIDPAFVADSIAKHATRTDIGAHELFLGQVRADALPEGNVVAIDYEAYTEMANDGMTAIREEAFAQWPITCLHVHHSIGRVDAGQLCFFVFASSAHRKDARAAVAFIVDAVKERLPIFGKEVLADGGHVWKSNHP